MAKGYIVSAGGQTLVNAVVTLVFINPIAAPNVNLHYARHWIGQSANATSAQQRAQLVTQVTAFPTVVSATPRSLGQEAISVIVGGTAGAAGTCGVNASAEGAGAKTVLAEYAFNVLNGLLEVHTPDEVIKMRAGSASGLGLYLPVAAVTLTNWTFGQAYSEV